MRNTLVEGITPSSSWSTASSTSPLKISKHESPLTSGAIPNPHYHRLPAQLARRQSSSYNHVRNNALVSNSPFKLRGEVKPSRIPTPSRATTKEDENKPELGFKRRQSRGLQGLFKEQVVTKSPFLGDKRPNTVTEAPPPSPPKPSPSPVSSRLETIQPRAPTPPMPATPRNPRITDLSGQSPSPSPRSSLVSPKRLHGPRSLSASPASEGARRQRRKTVTWDDRCDVLEFDKDEVPDDAIEIEDDEDDYGLPEPPSPAISASTDGSFASYASDPVLHSPQSPQIESPNSTPQSEPTAPPEAEFITRTPRISRDEVRRRLMEQRIEGFEDIPEVTSLQATPDTSLSLPSPRVLELSLAASEDLRPNGAHSQSQHTVSDQGDFRVDPPFDFGDPDVDLGEMHSALDRLMLGVESGFRVELTDGESMDVDTATEGDISASISTTTLDVEGNMKAVNGETGSREQLNGNNDQMRVTQNSVGSTDDDTDEPATPPLDNYVHKAPAPDKYDDGMRPKPLTDYSMSDPVSIRSDGNMLPASGIDYSEVSMLGTPELDLSISDLEHANPPVRTSTPPRSSRKDHHPAVVPSQGRDSSSSSVALPPLSFASLSAENPTHSPAWDSHVSRSTPPQLPPSIRDDTFLVRSSSTASTATNNSIPPPVPPKDNTAIPQRDEFVKARRREMLSESSGYDRPATYHEGRPSRRRSLSTGDAEDLGSSVSTIVPTLSCAYILFTETCCAEACRSFKR